MLRFYRIDCIKDIIPNAFENEYINKGYLENNYESLNNQNDFGSNRKDTRNNIVKSENILYVFKIELNHYLIR